MAKIVYYDNSEELKSLFNILIKVLGKTIEYQGYKGKYRLTDITSDRVHSIKESMVRYMVEALYSKVTIFEYFEFMMGMPEQSKEFKLMLSIMSNEDKQKIMNCFKVFARKLNCYDMMVSDCTGGIKKTSMLLKIFEIS